MSTEVSLRSNEGAQVAQREDMPHTEDARMYLTQVHEDLHPMVAKVRERFAQHDGVHLCVAPAETVQWLTSELFNELGRQYSARANAGHSTVHILKAMDAARFHANELRLLEA